MPCAAGKCCYSRKWRPYSRVIYSQYIWQIRLLLHVEKFSSHWKCARLAQLVRSLTANQRRPGFNPRPCRGLNFEIPSFATPPLGRDVKPLVQSISQRSIAGLFKKEPHELTYLSIRASRLMLVLWIVNGELNLMSQTKKHCKPLIAVWLRPSTTEPCICNKQVAEKHRAGEHLEMNVWMYGWIPLSSARTLGLQHIF